MSSVGHWHREQSQGHESFATTWYVDKKTLSMMHVKCKST